LLYIAVLRRKRRYVLRFANMHLLEQVAPRQPRNWWRHVAAVLMIVSLVFFTVATAAPTHAVQIPRDRAVVMLVIDVSESMAATDVSPSRLDAAKEAGKNFADELTPGINLGLVAFAGTASVLVAPTTNRAVMKAAIDQLQAAERTATGEGIYTALQAIATIGAVVGGGEKPPPARIVLESDGKETVPGDPNSPRGAFPAARAANAQGVPIEAISFGSPDGVVQLNGLAQPVPVDDVTLQEVARLSGGQLFHADSLQQLSTVYAGIQHQFGYETVRGDASSAWLRLGAAVLVIAALVGLMTQRRLPA
jgi:Ca-activated chloride channel family protein